MPKETLGPKDPYETHVSFYASELINMLQNTPNRLFIGITGGPASGKSTFANDLVAAVNLSREEIIAMVLPMDGFHLPNAVLRTRGMWELKGIPDTFDALGFIDLMNRLKDHHNERNFGPLFDRATDEPVPNALVFEPSHRLIIVEGNYLLFNKPPWDKARDMFAEVWYLETPRKAVMPRLRDRHAKRGLQGEEIGIKIASTDLPNAQLIASTRSRASRILHLPQNKQLS